MPGKVNPVILESCIQIALQAAANDRLVFDACSRSSLQINEFMPLVAHAFLGSLDLLLQANRMLARHLKTIEAVPEVCASHLAASPMIITALLPQIGYSRAEQLLEEYRRSTPGHAAGDFRTFLADKLGRDVVDKTLSAQALTQTGFTER